MRKNYARDERLSLAGLMFDVGPDAPTLCEGWTVRDLAVHLVIRDRRPLALPGNAAPQLAERFPPLERYASSAESEFTEMPFEQLVGLMAEGAPMWSPAKLSSVDRVMNTAEFLVHHEDVRRAADEWKPRRLSWDMQMSVWPLLKMLVLPQALSIGKHLIFDAPGFAGTTAGPKAKGILKVTGEPLEILLWVYGRKDHAVVDVEEFDPPEGTDPEAEVDMQTGVLPVVEPCPGDDGASGDDGAAGADGDDGADGASGADASAEEGESSAGGDADR